jgi:UDP-N-acetylglucosamine--N-acetylmuramyl-(pentapeptide) pyrophosphoryl-undecaprenol N-acetylglucosamine transferase
VTSERRASDPLTASARPSILIPFPGATDDHQRKNAEVLARNGAATMVEQRELTGERLAREILALVESEAERRRMGEAAARLAKPDAASAIVDKVVELAK